MTRPEAAELVAMLVAAYPRQTMTTATAEVYERMLVDLDREAAAAACERLAATLRYFPSIAEIRAAVAEDSVAPGRISASEAWAHVLAEVHRVGWPHPERAMLDDAQRSAIATLGGWHTLCESEEPPGVLRAHFMRAYDEAVSSSVRREALHGLPSAQERPALEARRGGATVEAGAVVARLMSGEPAQRSKR